MRAICVIGSTDLPFLFAASPRPTKSILEASKSICSHLSSRSADIRAPVVRAKTTNSFTWAILHSFSLLAGETLVPWWSLRRAWYERSLGYESFLSAHFNALLESSQLVGEGAVGSTLLLPEPSVLQDLLLGQLGCRDVAQVRSHRSPLELRRPCGRLVSDRLGVAPPGVLDGYSSGTSLGLDLGNNSSHCGLNLATISCSEGSTKAFPLFRPFEGELPSPDDNSVLWHFSHSCVVPLGAIESLRFQPQASSQAGRNLPNPRDHYCLRLLGFDIGDNSSQRGSKLTTIIRSVAGAARPLFAAPNDSEF